MDKSEIERMKQGIINAMLKAPGNQIMKDFEAAVLTVEQLQSKLDTANLQKDSLQKAYDALFAAANRVYHKYGFDKDWTEWKDLMDCLSSPLPSADLKRIEGSPTERQCCTEAYARGFEIGKARGEGR